MSEPQFFIENGYLEIGLWVTYRCNVGCPHCYLRALKTKSEDLTLNKFYQLLQEIKAYRSKWELLRFTIYGAEPQSLLPEYYYDLIDLALDEFPNAQFSMFTSLQVLDEKWLGLLKYMHDKFPGVTSAVSYDGDMRGQKYNDNLFKNLEILKDNHIRIGFMCVMNKSLLELGAKHFVDLLVKYKTGSFSIKPFLPIDGQMDNFNTWAVSMDEYSDFLIDVHQELKARKLEQFSGLLIDVCNDNSILNSLGAYTFFVDGALRVMYMDYTDSGAEFLQEFGQITPATSFKDIVEGVKRKEFLEKQRLVFNQEKCMVCDYTGRCLAEVYKKAYDDSKECVGAFRFVNWARTNYGILNVTRV